MRGGDPRALFGRHSERALAAEPCYRKPTYYDRPALKPAPWDYLIAMYIFIAGISGSAQMIATAADFLGGRRVRSVVRHGRALALAGAIVGPPLLVADLKTPHRFYNMLRIVRPTSPMSIGSWILSSFGLFSAATAGGEAFRSRGERSLPMRVARLAQVPAAITGAGMGTYTASLLSATSTPLWSASPGLLAARFASSSMATGAAALSLAEHANGTPENSRTLDKVALAATATELAASVAEERQYSAKGVAGPLQDTRWGTAHSLGVALGVGVPLACYTAGLLSRRRSRGLSIAASLAVLAGGMLMRQATLYAGMESAERPADYFRLARPGSRPEAPGSRRLRRDLDQRVLGR